MIFVFFLSAWLGIVSGCVRTADSGTGTTLPPSVTITVPGATTTVPGATTTAAGTSELVLSAALPLIKLYLVKTIHLNVSVLNPVALKTLI